MQRTAAQACSPFITPIPAGLLLRSAERGALLCGHGITAQAATLIILHDCAASKRSVEATAAHVEALYRVHFAACSLLHPARCRGGEESTAMQQPRPLQTCPISTLPIMLQERGAWRGLHRRPSRCRRLWDPRRVWRCLQGHPPAGWRRRQGPLQGLLGVCHHP